VAKLDKRTEAALVAFGAHVRKVREDLEIAQVQLAQRIGMDPTNLAKIERGARNVTMDTLVRIADGLGIKLVVKLAPTVNHRRKR
jgi:transcriptional regulator with XRE-family HTH domain